MYLLIQNPGVAPVEAYTLLGASGSRNNAAATGMFGTGNKSGICCLLREGYDVTVYCGLTRLEYSVDEIPFEGGVCDQVMLSVNGKAPKPLGWTLDWGKKDWTEPSMGLRELVTNALDASNKGNGYEDDMETGDLSIRMVDSKRASANYTRVYVSERVEEDGLLEKFLEELPKRFLHFSFTPMDQVILSKANRSLSNSERAMVYLQGVFICELEGPSIYDYNFPAGAIEIDECRNSNEYSVRASIARLMRKATAAELTPLFESIGKSEIKMESKLDPYYLLPSWDCAKEEERVEWQAAWKQAHGEAILTSTDARTIDFVQQKGMAAQSVDSAGWRETLEKFGIAAAKDVLTAGELVGRQPVGVDGATYDAFHYLWDKICDHTERMNMPMVGCFREEGTSNVLSYVDGMTIFVREGLNHPQTCKAILEGFAAYVTGTCSMTKAFQDWAFELLVDLL